MSKILRNFDKFVKAVEATTVQTLKGFEESIRDEIIQGTPKDTGALRDSYDFGPTAQSSKYLTHYAFSFGYNLTNDQGEPYAGIVHEWYDSNVTWTVAGTGPGYLVRPVMANSKNLKSIYAVNYRRIRI